MGSVPFSINTCSTLTPGGKSVNDVFFVCCSDIDDDDFIRRGLCVLSYILIDDDDFIFSMGGHCVLSYILGRFFVPAEEPVTTPNL